MLFNLIRPLAVLALILPMRTHGQSPGEGLWPAWDKSGLQSRVSAEGIQLNPEFQQALGSDSLHAGILLLNGQCTGAFLTKTGLFITNHHCILEALEHAAQRGEHWLRNGFWAGDQSQERPLNGMSAAILRKVEDVSAKVQPAGADPGPEALEARIEALESGSETESGLKAEVKSFDAGSRHLLFSYEVFHDLRLVGVPAEAVARLGGEQSYGKWPMCAADFALIRVYANAQNQQAEYHRENRPYQPDFHFKTALSAPEAGHAVLAIGYPGATDLYQSSWELRAQSELVMPVQMRMAAATRAVLAAQMDRSSLVERDYGSVFRALTHSGKSMGVIQAAILARDLADVKAATESGWLGLCSEDEKKQRQQLFADLAATHDAYAHLQARSLGLRLLISWSGILRLARNAQDLSQPVNGKNGQRLWMHSAKMLRSQIRQHFHHYHRDTDQKILAALFEVAASLPEADLPPLLVKIKRKYRGDFGKFAARLFKQSAFSTQDRALELLESLAANETRPLQKDAAYRLVANIAAWHDETLAPEMVALEARLRRLQQAYISLILHEQKDRQHYPDANGTLRYSFGRIAPLEFHGDAFAAPEAMQQAIELSKTQLPQAFLSRMQAANWGRAGEKMALCFLAAVHSSNGNSGSPVLDAEGRLLGIDMARTEAGWISDVYYDPEVVRAVVLDMRYVLFVTEVLSKDSRLVDEILAETGV